jgi:general L-amino acid transport system substrate-binding protein
MNVFARGLAGIAVGLFCSASFAATLDSVRERGFVNCGVGENFPGFFAPTARASGRGWTSISVARFRR